jgi:predicted Zn-dependent protease
MNELSSNNATILNDLAYLTAFRKTDDQATRDADFRESLNLIDKAMNLEENNPMPIDTKGLILMAQGRPAEAVPLFEKAVELANQSIIYRLHLAVALLRAGEKDQAESEFAAIRDLLVPQIELLPESNRDYTREMLEAFPGK